jgi:hypothetical protein
MWDFDGGFRGAQPHEQAHRVAQGAKRPRALCVCLLITLSSCYIAWNFELWIRGIQQKKVRKE